MSKAFEQAYKELAQMQTPDLWARIEAGLTEKSTPAVDDMEAEKAAELQTVSRREVPKKSSGIINFMKKYSAVAAAVVCVAILIPAISFMGRLGIGDSKSDTMEAPAEMAEDYAYTEGAEILTEEAAAEVYTEREPEQEVMMQETAAVEEYAEEEVEIPECADAEAEECKQAIKADNTDAAVMEGGISLAEKCPEGTIVKAVQVKVTAVSEMTAYFEGTDREEIGYICNAQVRKHADGQLTEGEEIAIFISGYSSIALTEGGIYRLDLESFAVEEECYFEIEKYDTQIDP